MLRPFRGYRELVAEAEPPSFVLGVARFLVVVGAFVALTVTGRLAPVEMGQAMFSFTWIPLVHAMASAPTTPYAAASVAVAQPFTITHTMNTISERHGIR